MRRRQQRRAFTLVELLVAMALIVFIMSILSGAFVAATKSFRDLKAAGDMAERLRSVSSQLRRELAADHFEGKRRLSQDNFWLNGPPEQGFFRVWQGSAPGPTNPAYTLEGTDDDGIESYRAVDHMLHFTVKLRGNNRSDLFSAQVPPAFLGMFPATGGEQDPLYMDSLATYNYAWAEVAYFLRPAVDPQTGQQDDANGIPLFSLYRRQRLLVPDNSRVPAPPPPPAGTGAWSSADFMEVSYTPNPPAGAPAYAPTTVNYFNNPGDITVPERRFGTGAGGMLLYTDPFFTTPPPRRTYPTLTEEVSALTTPTQAQVGMRAADLLLTDVVSFEVRLLFGDQAGAYATADPVNPFVHLYNSAVDTAYNYTTSTSPLFQAAGPRVFDTWSSKFSPGGAGNPADYSIWNDPANSPNTAIPMWNPTVRSGPVVKAIQITIRVWDQKTSLTRQITIVQAL